MTPGPDSSLWYLKRLSGPLGKPLKPLKPIVCKISFKTFDLSENRIKTCILMKKKLYFWILSLKAQEKSLQSFVIMLSRSIYEVFLFRLLYEASGMCLVLDLSFVSSGLYNGLVMRKYF